MFVAVISNSHNRLSHLYAVVNNFLNLFSFLLPQQLVYITTSSSICQQLFYFCFAVVCDSFVRISQLFIFVNCFLFFFESFSFLLCFQNQNSQLSICLWYKPDVSKKTLPSFVLFTASGFLPCGTVSQTSFVSFRCFRESALLYYHATPLLSTHISAFFKVGQFLFWR